MPDLSRFCVFTEGPRAPITTAERHFEGEIVVQNRTQIVRARWQLWLATFMIVSSLSGIVIFLAASSEDPVSIAFLPSRALLGIALGGMIIAFFLYALDRERNLHRLADRLFAEQLASERLSARLQYLAELSRERDMNAALLEGSAEALAVLDGEGRIVRFNPAMEAFVSVRGAEVVGQGLVDVIGFEGPEGEPMSESDHPLTLVLKDGAARAGHQLQLVLPSGQRRWVSATLSPILDDGTPTAVLVSFSDIADQKEQEAMMRDFVSMAAHELRSPLTAIKGFAQTLIARAEQIPAEHRTRYLSMVNEQSDRLARLVDDLMQVSRIDARRITLEREPVDLSVLVSAIIEQFRGKWQERSIDVSARGDTTVADADPHQAGEILINLIDNAVKYSPPAAPVIVKIHGSDGEVRVDVRDHGSGMTHEEQASLFEKFRRLPSAKASDVPGTGLGLYIVRGLVEAHGGRVWVTSTLNEGSTFSFTLPADASEVPREVASA